LKRYEVHFLAEAIDDIDALFCYIAEKASIEVADQYLARIEKLCLSLEFFPQRGTSVAGDVEGLRTMGFERRVTILFRVGQDRVDILRILYGGQNLEPVIEKL
jgi:toxin ParE1/3/4